MKTIPNYWKSKEWRKYLSLGYGAVLILAAGWYWLWALGYKNLTGPVTVIAFGAVICWEISKKQWEIRRKIKTHS